MSFELMAWAVKQKLPANKKIVLLLLANRTNNDTKRCTPRIKLLADDCGMSETTCKACLKALAESGHITVVPRFHDGVQGANQYIVNSDGVGRDLVGGGSKSDPGVGRNPTTETGSFETGNETTTSPKDGRPSNDEIIKAYQEICGGVFKGAEVMTKKREANVKNLMKFKVRGVLPFRDQGIDFWKAYFTDCLADKHWRGESTNGTGWKADFEFITREDNVAKVLGV